MIGAHFDVPDQVTVDGGFTITVGPHVQGAIFSTVAISVWEFADVFEPHASGV